MQSKVVILLFRELNVLLGSMSMAPSNKTENQFFSKNIMLTRKGPNITANA